MTAQGGTVPENAHNAGSGADITASLDDLQALAPGLGAVSLVVGWFGSRSALRIVRHQARRRDREEDHLSRNLVRRWRRARRCPSRQPGGGRPAYGGTPSDASVVAAIADLKARGLRVLFNPFLFMDIATGNALADPYTGAAPQPAYPWRGRITCDPAPGVAGSPDKTAAAATQVDAFFGSAAPADFTVTGTTVAYTGAEPIGAAAAWCCITPISARRPAGSMPS